MFHFAQQSKAFIDSFHFSTDCAMAVKQIKNAVQKWEPGTPKELQAYINHPSHVKIA